MTNTNETKITNLQGIEIPEDLILRLHEIIAWRKTGKADLSCLTEYIDDHLQPLRDTGADVLRIAEDRALMEAANILLKIAGRPNE